MKIESVPYIRFPHEYPILLKQNIIYSAPLLFITVLFYACDSTSVPDPNFGSEPVINRFDIDPQNVQFSASVDGNKDTTLLIHFEAGIQNLSDSLPVLTLINQSNQRIEVQDRMQPISSGNYHLEIPIETRTTSYVAYRVNILAKNDPASSTYAWATLSYDGFSELPPQILSVDNPDTVSIPESDTELYAFTAFVTDPEGQDTIESVLLRISRSGFEDVSGSPFQLFDDGNNGSDETASDSVFTVTFPVDPNSQTETFELSYYAIDKGGLISDTVYTQFTITN